MKHMQPTQSLYEHTLWNKLREKFHPDVRAINIL